MSISSAPSDTRLIPFSRAIALLRRKSATNNGTSAIRWRKGGSTTGTTLIR